MTNFNFCTSIWNSGIPTLEGYYIYLIFGKGIAIALFIMVFIVLIFVDYLFSYEFNYLMEGMRSVEISHIEDLIEGEMCNEVDMYYSLINDFNKDIFLYCEKQIDFYQIFSFLIPIFSINLFEINHNKGGALDYFSPFYSRVRGVLSCVSFQWGWDLEWRAWKMPSVKHFLINIEGESYITFKRSLGIFNNYKQKKVEVLNSLDERVLKEIRGEVAVFVEPCFLILNSKDVIHSFSCSEWGVKLDSIPGRVNSTILEVYPSQFTYSVECSEFCGVGHPFMGFKIQSITELEMSLLLKMKEVSDINFYNEGVNQINNKIKLKVFTGLGIVNRMNVEKYIFRNEEKDLNLEFSKFIKTFERRHLNLSGIQERLRKINIVPDKSTTYIYGRDEKKKIVDFSIIGCKSEIRKGLEKYLRYKKEYIVPNFKKDKYGWIKAININLCSSIIDFNTKWFYKGFNNFENFAHVEEKKILNLVKHKKEDEVDNEFDLKGLRVQVPVKIEKQKEVNSVGHFEEGVEGIDFYRWFRHANEVLNEKEERVIRVGNLKRMLKVREAAKRVKMGKVKVEEFF